MQCGTTWTSRGGATLSALDLDQVASCARLGFLSDPQQGRFKFGIRVSLYFINKSDFGNRVHYCPLGAQSVKDL